VDDPRISHRHFAYITDTNGIPPASMKLLEGVEVLALDGLRPATPHPTHFTITEAVACARKIGRADDVLDSSDADVDHETLDATLPRESARLDGSFWRPDERRTQNDER
jgi:phosphoribosyl 1,2-cyclic phosphodiesterase